MAYYGGVFERLRYAQLLEPAVALSRRWVYLVVSALTLVFLGFLYGWSILAAPLQDAFGWNTAQLALTFSISTAMFCVGGVVGAQLTKRTAPRCTLWLSAALIALGYTASALLAGSALEVIYLAYGVCMGGATGMAYNAIIASINNWFPDRVGTSSGALTLGFGIGSLVLGPVVGAGIDAWGWQLAFIGLGLVTCAVVLIGSLVVRSPHEEQELPRQAPAKRKPAPPQKRTTPSGLNFTTRQMLRCPAFYLTFITAVLLASMYLATMGNAKLIALEMGAAATAATLMVGLVSAGDGVSRLGSGLFFDRFGYRVSLVMVATLFLASALTLYAAYETGELALIGVGFVLLGLGFGSISTVFAAIINRFFGPKNYGSNLSVAFLDFVPASVIGPPLISVVQTYTGSFKQSFLILSVFAVVALVSALRIFPPQELPQGGPATTRTGRSRN